MKFKLSKYIIPSVVSMVLVGSSTNIDGLFIGNVTGDSGLAAINFAWPIVALITSIGTGIGVGGSVILSTLRGKNDHDGAERVKLAMIILLAAAGLFCTAALAFAYKPLLSLMGASGEVLEYGCEYSLVIVLGAVFQVLGAGLVALLRNERKTYFSMVCCIVGLITHVVLDVSLVKKYALAGVAVSTVASQAVIMALCLFNVKIKKGTKIDFSVMPQILKASTSPLGINFVLSLVLLFTNYFAQSVGGTEAVAAYTVMSYAVYTFDYVFQGVVDGVQPIISYCVGSGDKEGERRALKSCAIILGVSALAFAALTPALIELMPIVFSVSSAAKEMMKTGFIIYAFSYPFKAAVKFVCAYYYACGKTLISNVLIYIDPLILTPLLLLGLSAIMGINGIWLSFTLTQLLVAIPGIVTFIRTRKKKL